MNEPTVSAYMQCYSHKAALFHTLQSFRACYPVETVTLISDCGEDFFRFGEHFSLRYCRSNVHADPGRLGVDGAMEYLGRIYEHCAAAASDFVVILEEDVTTLRRITKWPVTTCAGPRFNAFTQPLNAYLRRVNKTRLTYGYGMSGGSIFDRLAFIRCYERTHLNLGFLESLDKGLTIYGDMILTALFLLNGHSYGVWDDVSELHHPVQHLRISREAAFDHADKRRYDAPFDEELAFSRGGTGWL